MSDGSLLEREIVRRVCKSEEQGRYGRQTCRQALTTPYLWCGECLAKAMLEERERDTRAGVPPAADRVLARVRSIAACGNQPPCSVCNAQIFAIAADLEAIAASVPTPAPEP